MTYFADRVLRLPTNCAEGVAMRVGDKLTRILFGASFVLSFGLAMFTDAASATPFTRGDVFVSVSNGLVREFTPSGVLVQTLNTGNPQDETAGSAFDAFGNLFVTTFFRNTVAKFDNNGLLINRSFASGFNQGTESISFTRSGDIFVGDAGGNQIFKLNSNGVIVGTFATTVDRGTDWIDCACDQHTIYYTSEGNSIRRFDTLNNNQLPDFNILPLPGMSTGATATGNAYAML